MKKSVSTTIRYILTGLISGASFITLGAAAPDNIFTVPDNLVDNVAFWKKIYTDVSLSEGLIHDREYPLVIYEKINLSNRSPRSEARYIRARKAHYRAVLRAILNSDSATATAEQRRIAALFKEHAPAKALATAYQRIRFQRGQKDRFYAGLRRSGMYLDTIKAILTDYNVPLRLAYLPHVESSFDHTAYSKVGAAGLWQFMRGTAKNYLTVNYLIDERRDPILSTVAAAKLLSYNYSVLTSWPLSITAYNHGLYGMKRAVARTGSRDIGVIIEKHTSRTFRFASKNFYSCFLAASEIAENTTDYFPHITYLTPIRTTNSVLPAYIRPKTVAHYLSITQEELRELNPALRPAVFRHQKLIPAGYVLRLPAALDPDAVRVSLASIPDSLKSDTPERPQYYRVRRGDNLYSIAYRLGVSAKDIAFENNITRMNRIYAGQVLRIPSGMKKAAPVIASTKKTPQKKPLPKNTEVPPPPPVSPDTVATAADTAPPALPDSLREIVMATADTLPPAPSTIMERSRSPFDVEVYDLEAVLSSTGNAAEITVTVDETIGHYADWLGIATMKIRRLNRMGRRSTIRINRTLLIPVEETDALERFAAARLEYHLAIEEDFYSQYTVVDVKAYTIRRGENLWTLCNGEEQLPLWLFKKYNKHLDLSRLMPGTVVWIPVIEEKTDEDRELEQHHSGQYFPLYHSPIRPQQRFIFPLP
jgi:membrane-bound lytic murein transglycosylase D